MIKSLLITSIFILLIQLNANSEDFSAYKVFNKSGKEVDFKDLVKSANSSEVVLFGELHNNPISHWLELQLTKAMFEEHNDDLVLGAEMFESDDQMIIDEYFSGLIAENNFKKEAKLWNNYSTDYKPLLEFAKENKLKFIATNIPRRYASLVSKKGFDALDDLTKQAKKLIAPLEIDYDPELPGYKKMKEMSMPGHGMDFIAEAQAIKDATMAHFILENLDDAFLHFNGSYHSNNFEGISWYLKKEKEKLKILTISSVLQENLDELAEQNQGIADFIIVIPADMTTTY